MPIYRQIVRCVRSAVASGVLVPGDQIPAVRELAESNTINPNTVVKAYTELVREGIIVGRPGSGYFVRACGESILSLEEREKRLDLALQSLIADTTFLGFTPAEVQKRLGELQSEIEKRKQKNEQKKL